jgi:hypothetical protein
MVGTTKAVTLQSMVPTECHDIIQKGLSMSLYYVSLGVKLNESVASILEAKNHI